jgi:hypothetical protein
MERADDDGSVYGANKRGGVVQGPQRRGSLTSFPLSNQRRGTDNRSLVRAFYSALTSLGIKITWVSVISDR